MKKYASDKSRTIIKVMACVLLLIGCGVCINMGLQKKENYADDTTKVTRGVVNTLDQLPETKKKAGGPEGTLGSKQNPFLILEVVPYEEYAEFGYLISGCEPVKIDEMFGKKNYPSLSSLADTLNNGITDPKAKPAVCKEYNDAYFFPDEPEGDISKYDTPSLCSFLTEEKTLYGYYERVAEGSGVFVQDPATKQITKTGHGNIVWHTIQDEDKGSIDFGDGVIHTLLRNAGDIVYTTRSSTASDTAYHMNSCYTKYENNDLFLKDTLQLTTKEERDKYCVVIKTITPSELNRNPKWVEYSNLIYISPLTHVSLLTEVWSSYNRYNHEATPSSERRNTFYNNDISWEVAMKIFNKASASTNYCGVIFDKSAVSYSMLWNETKKVAATKVWDWNNPAREPSTVSLEASNNNVFKLSVMLTSMDMLLFKSKYIDTGYINADGEYTLQPEGSDARTYWSYYTFYPDTPEENGTYEGHGNNWYAYWTSQGLWDAYKMSGNLLESDFLTDGRVHTFNGDNSIIQAYMTFHVEAGDNETMGGSSKYTDFSDYMKDNFPGNVPDPSDAIRYILGIMVPGTRPTPTPMPTDPPVIDVKDSREISDEVFEQVLTQEFNSDTSGGEGGNQVVGEEFGEETVPVRFEITDPLYVITSFQILYDYTENGSDRTGYIATLYDGDVTLTADVLSHKFSNVEKNKVYTFYFPKKYLQPRTEDGKNLSAIRRLRFEAVSNSGGPSGTARLDFRIRALFELD